MSWILVAASDGLHAFDDAGTRRPVEHEGRSVTALGRARDDVWAVLDAAEIWRRTAGTWSHVTDLDGLRATCVAAIGPEVFVGSSEARVFRLAGNALESVESFDRMDGRSTWFTPWGGPPDTRSIANWDDDVYVNVHVGGVPRTSDGGATWTPTIEIEADVHHVTTADGLVLAACARGLAASADRGTTWTYLDDGLEARYSRAVAVCGDDLLLTASNGPRGGRAGVYRAAVSGGRFVRCRAGLPEWFDDNVDTYCLDALPDGSLAAFGTTDGRVFASRDAGSSWAEIAGDLPSVRRVLVMPSTDRASAD
jgi:hypothetical protein